MLELFQLGFQGGHLLLQPGCSGCSDFSRLAIGCFHLREIALDTVIDLPQRIQSSRRLERETQRNIELMWLLGRFSPDFKTIADFQRDNGTGIRNVCRQFVVLCRELNLLTHAVVAIDGSKLNAVNSHDRNFTRGKLEKRTQEP